MNYCCKCGNKVSPGDRFCDKCGNNLQIIQDISTQNIKTVQTSRIICPKCGCKEVTKQIQDSVEEREMKRNVIQTFGDILSFFGTINWYIIGVVVLFFVNFIVGIIIIVLNSIGKNKKIINVKVRETIGICNNCGNTWTIDKQDL